MNSKIKVLLKFLIIFALIFIFILIYLLLTKNNQNSTKKIKIATALPNVKDLLDSEPIRKTLKKKNFDLEVTLLSNNFPQTQELLLKDQVIAKLDSHLPWSNSIIEKSENQLKVAHPLYFAKFSLYSLKTSKHKIEDLNSLKQKIEQNEEIKILIPEQKIQQNLALLFLEQIQLLTRKEDAKNKKTNLTQKDFEMSKPNLTLQEVNITGPGILERFEGEAENQKIIITNYPTIMKPKEEKLITLASLSLPKKEDNQIDENNNLIPYIISLITKPKNMQSESIQALKEILSQDNIINSFFDKLDPEKKLYEPISSQFSDLITQKINE